MESAYFERAGPMTFRPTLAVQGAWSTREQHVAPALGLMAHGILRDHVSRRGDELELSRLSFDILGTLPIEPVEIAIDVRRTGRTIELVEATLSHDGRAAVIGRAWMLRTHDTRELAGSELARMPSRDELPPWDMSEIWQGEFVRTAEIRRREARPGRAWSWVRSLRDLVQDEPADPASRLVGLIDIANGLTPRALPDVALFPNLDLTVHLFRQPRGEWIGFDTTVSFGPNGLGLTESVLHDDDGPLGTSSQTLTVRPRVA